MPFFKPLTALASLAVLLLAAPAEATHFRYGNIRYARPDPVGQPRAVDFDVTVAWRAEFPEPITLMFGDGANSGALMGAEIAAGVDAAGLTYKLFRYTAKHTYPNNGQDQFTPYFSGCCRTSNLVNAGDDSFAVGAQVDLSAGNEAGPITAIPPFIYLQTGGVRSHFIPQADPDGVPVTCRFATPAESWRPVDVMPPKLNGTGALPVITPSQSPPGCLLTWDTTGGVAGQYYWIQAAVESINPASGNISTSILDYNVVLVASPPPTCKGTNTFVIPMGSALTTDVTGANNAGGASLSLLTIYQNGVFTPPSGLLPSPGQSTFQWSPGLGEEGAYIATAIFTDAKNVSGYCSLTLEVPACPQYGQPCSVGVGACQKSGKLQCTGPNNTPECSAQPGMPTKELCDGVDNDCDGAVDEDFPLGNACASGVGACAATGVMACDGMGGVACNAAPGAPEPEVCGNGVDDDCDGAIDEGCGADAGMGGGGGNGSSGVGGGGGNGSSGVGGGGGGGDDPIVIPGCACAAAASDDTAAGWLLFGAAAAIARGRRRSR